MNETEQKAIVILNRLTEAGYDAYFVGGYVRDRVVGRPVRDIDIATSAKPDQVIRLFARTVPTGLKHGTVTVIIEGTPFEVTTFRKEAEYEKRRRPKCVQFVADIKSDLSRRDFTINAMALDRNGRLLDPFAGASDLAERILRCVGDPEERFAEDALRIIRCIRFAAEYELTVEPATWAALIRQRSGLKEVAMERVRMELERMVEGLHPERSLALFSQAKLPRYLKQDLEVEERQWDIFTAMETTRCFKQLADGDLRWCQLLLLLQLDREQASVFLRKLTFSGKRKKKLIALLSFQATLENELTTEREPEVVWKRTALHAGPGVAELWLEWLPALAAEPILRRHRLSRHMLSILADHGPLWLKQMPVRNEQQLAVNGQDLRMLRAEPGPWIGRLMTKLTEQVALGMMDNERSALMAQAKRSLNHSDQSGR